MMTEHQTLERCPSIDEAVALMRGAFTRVYRRACLDYWRKRYGETFAARVEREFMRVWKKPVEAA